MRMIPEVTLNAEGSSLEAVRADSCGMMDSNTLREQVK